MNSSQCFKGGVLLTIAISVLGGCANERNALQAQSRVNPVSPVTYLANKTGVQCPLTWGSVTDTRKGAIDLDCYVFPNVKPSYYSEQVLINDIKKGDKPESLLQYRVDRSSLAYTMALSSASDRNRLTSILLKHSDDVCTLELGRLTANEATTNASLSILSTGFSAAATVVGGELAKSILSGTSTLLGASRDHINVHVYRNTIAQAVSQVISGERKSINSSIQGRYGSTISEWSIDDAIRAVNTYHQQCSFYKGLELLLKAADNNTDLNSYRAARIQQSKISKISQAIADLNIALGKADDANKAAIQSKIAELELGRAKLQTGTDDEGEADQPEAIVERQPDPN